MMAEKKRQFKYSGQGDVSSGSRNSQLRYPGFTAPSFSFFRGRVSEHSTELLIYNSW